MGISNWALDPAKMNRAVHLHRPAPTERDLAYTARGMLRVDGDASADRRSKGAPDAVLPERLLRGLATAYTAVYENQKLPDFWGLREFYSLVKAVRHRSVGCLVVKPTFFYVKVLHTSTLNGTLSERIARCLFWL